MMDCVFQCDVEPESHCSSKKSHDSLRADSLLLGLQSVLRNVYVAEAILFKRLEMSSTTEETEKLSIALTRLSEVEKKLNLRIIDHGDLCILVEYYHNKTEFERHDKFISEAEKRTSEAFDLLDSKSHQEEIPVLVIEGDFSDDLFN